MGREVAGDFWQNKGQICWKNTNIAIDIAKKILTNIDIYIDINIAKTNFKNIDIAKKILKNININIVAETGGRGSEAIQLLESTAILSFKPRNVRSLIR